jgi:dTDP-4-dehydrorhamnose 3,5-epimerase
MRVDTTELPGVLLVTPEVFVDPRGFFVETYHEERYAQAGMTEHFVQDNHSKSGQGTLRGLHAQRTRPQAKLVRCTQGLIWDVAVDIRQGSPTFGRWVGAELTADNHHMLWVPPGFGHGFMVLSDSVHFLYKCTEFYYPEDERAIRWDDADIGVQWPLPAGVQPLISGRDAAARAFRDAEYYP